MRPGAPFKPCSVWHELQSPEGGDFDIARTLPPATTFTLIGVVKLSAPSSRAKFPLGPTGSEIVFPVASTMTTSAPDIDPLAPKHPSGSCTVG